MKDEEFVSGLPSATPDRLDGDEEFAYRISAELRVPESVSDEFEARVMAAVRNEALMRTRSRASWWRRPVVALSPASTLALAAGLAAVAYLGGALTSRDPAASPQATVAGMQPDTVHVVRFVFFDGAASSVHIVGDFNQWRKEATPLVRGSAAGVWTASVPVAAGVHEYAFIVDGQRWEVDPFALSITDEFGTASSLLSVDAPTSS